MRKRGRLVPYGRTVAAYFAPVLWTVPTYAAEVESQEPETVGTVEFFAGLVNPAIEAVGILVIIIGVVLATAIFLRDGLRGPGWEAGYQRYRANLGRGILLGLELLVAADIIGTVVAPLDLRSIAILGLIVLIRTFLSFSLEVEINGHWPWQESRYKRESASKAGTGVTGNGR